MSTNPYAPDLEALLERARVRSAEFHETYIKPAARESAGTAMAKPVGCQCKTPRPTPAEAGCFICGRCRSPLRVDAKGSPFRRFPGDLDTVDQVNARRVLEVAEMSKAEMMPLVAMLSPAQQKRLMAMPGRKFVKVARRMIQRHLAIQAAESAVVDIGPNSRRRLARRSSELADVVDDIAALAKQSKETP
jgi:hypothetical protein